MLDKEARFRRLRTLTMLIVILLPASERAQAADTAESAALPDTLAPGLPAGVGRAVRAAAAKLSNAGCSEIFSDFRDADGRTLQQNLDAVGQTGAGYLRWTIFFDGSGKRACAPASVMAWTNPGSRALFVCAPQFSAVEREKPGLAAALIIHEELHSLGLGENPPDSRVITARVIERCGK